MATEWVGDVPVVNAVAAWTGKYWRLVVPECPYCGREHSHGGGSKDIASEYGHRLSHCATGSQGRGYVLVPEEDDK